MWDLKLCLSAHITKIPRWKLPTLVLLTEGRARKAIWMISHEISTSLQPEFFNVQLKVNVSASHVSNPASGMSFLGFAFQFLPKGFFVVAAASIMQQWHLNGMSLQLPQQPPQPESPVPRLCWKCVSNMYRDWVSQPGLKTSLESSYLTTLCLHVLTC